MLAAAPFPVSSPSRLLLSRGLWGFPCRDAVGHVMRVRRALRQGRSQIDSHLSAAATRGGQDSPPPVRCLFPPSSLFVYKTAAVLGSRGRGGAGKEPSLLCMELIGGGGSRFSHCRCVVTQSCLGQQRELLSPPLSFAHDTCPSLNTDFLSLPSPSPLNVV